MAIDFNEILAGIFKKGLESSGEAATQATETGANISKKVAETALDPKAAMNVNPMNVGSSLVQDVAQSLSGGNKEQIDHGNPDMNFAELTKNAASEAYYKAIQNIQDPQVLGQMVHHADGILQQGKLKQIEQNGYVSSGIDDSGKPTPPESIMKFPQGLVSDTTGELADSEAQKKADSLKEAENVMSKAKAQAAEFGGKPEKGIMGHISGAIGRVFGTPGSTAATEAARTMGGMPASVASIGYAGQMPLTTYEQAQLGQQAQFKQAEQFGAATERMTNLLKATQPYSYGFLRPLGFTSQAEKTALGQLYGTERNPTGMVKKYGQEISKIGESTVQKLKSNVPPAAIAEAKRRGLLKGAK